MPTEKTHSCMGAFAEACMLTAVCNMVVCSACALQINYAVFREGVDYDINLFADAAMDIFHLRNTNDSEPKPAWLAYVTPGVDLDAAQQSLVQTLGRCVCVQPAILGG